MNRARTPPVEVEDIAAAERRGGIAVTLAYLMWGLFPLYLKPLSHVQALEVLAHRTAWCMLFVLGWMAWHSRLREIRAVFVARATLARLVLTACLISANWGVYLWAVANGRVIESSLGYFIGPLVNVLLGVLVLKESLGARQWAAVGVAAVGVVWLAVAAGGLPWVALALAASWGLYGLVRKVVPVGAVTGLAVETMLLAPLAVLWLLWLNHTGTGAFGEAPAHVSLLLVGSGLITAVPLALFSTGARLIPYSVAGLIGYITPTMQFLLGVHLFGEPFTGARAVGFSIIWTGIAIFAADGLLRSRPREPAVP